MAVKAGDSLGQPREVVVANCLHRNGLVSVVDGPDRAFQFTRRQANPEFISMVGAENLLKGAFIQEIESIPRSSRPLIESIRTLLTKGEEAGIFRPNVDPTQLYISIVALSFIHISSRYTLSATFGLDLAAPDLLAARRQHVIDLIMTYLKPPSA